MVNFEDLLWLFKQGEETRGIIRMNLAEAALLYKWAKLTCSSSPLSGKTIVEIGRKFGGSTVILSSCLNSSDLLYSIDIVLHESQVNENLKRCKNRGQVHLLTGDSKKIGKTWKEKIDLIFIDGDHSYKGVKTDIKIWLPHVKNYGHVIFHDVLGKKQELMPLIDQLKENNWKESDRADSTLCLQKIPL